MRSAGLLGFLSIAIVAGCGEGPPPRYPLPSNTLAGPALKAHMGEAVEIAATERDPATPHPIAVLREAVARAPIFDPTVTVPAGGSWQGAIAFDISSEDLASLEQIVGGAKLDLQMACAQSEI
jgi:hypothetical protein